MKNVYIGLTGYNHESSVALIDDKGKLIDYFREECLSRIKGDKSFPKRGLKILIEKYNLEFDVIKSVAFYERPLTAFLTPLKTAALNIPNSLSLISHQCRNFNKSSVSCFLDISNFQPGLERKLIYVDHHLSHTLTALLYSENQENLCSIVVDGFGDRHTASICKVNNKFDIKELWSCDYPVSLGLFYSAITDFLGFQVNEGEYKVMGLSSFGNSDSEIAKKVFNLINWDKESKEIKLDMSYFKYHISPTDSYSEKLCNLLGQPRNPFIPLRPEDKDFQCYADIARGAQDAVVQILCDMFEFAYSLTGVKRFLFSGGVSLNSASLDKISSLSNVEQIIIPPSPGDAGSSIGSAVYAYLKSSNNIVEKLPKPSLFPCTFNSNAQKDLASKIISKNFKILESDFNKSILLSSKLIQKGEVIGTIISNAETGPRALGNRSLICDGKNIDAVKNLNTVIKNRSPFRPTAPCMKIEVAKKYYYLREELMDCYKSMSATCKCLDDNVSLSFPTTHVDGTARIQIADKGQLIFDLLTETEKYDIDILANSSLNLSGDPTCFDLIDALMISSRKPLKYILTDFGILESNQ
tara:strand:- start:1944 stop:3689 length:1746 start_codon:yes stop_codon:yes gene_type:complete